MRIFQSEAVERVPPASGELRRATETGSSLLLEWISAFQEEATGGADARRIERSVAARLAGSSSWPISPNRARWASFRRRWNAHGAAEHLVAPTGKTFGARSRSAQTSSPYCSSYS